MKMVLTPLNPTYAYFPESVIGRGFSGWSLHPNGENPFVSELDPFLLVFFVPAEIENQQIAFHKRVEIQIVAQLLQAAMVIFRSSPDYLFHHISLLTIGDHDIHASFVGDIRLLEIEAFAVDDRLEIGHAIVPLIQPLSQQG